KPAAKVRETVLFKGGRGIDWNVDGAHVFIWFPTCVDSAGIEPTCKLALGFSRHLQSSSNLIVNFKMGFAIPNSAHYRPSCSLSMAIARILFTPHGAVEF